MRPPCPLLRSIPAGRSASAGLLHLRSLGAAGRGASWTRVVLRSLSHAVPNDPNKKGRLRTPARAIGTADAKERDGARDQADVSRAALVASAVRQLERARERARAMFAAHARLRSYARKRLTLADLVMLARLSPGVRASRSLRLRPKLTAWEARASSPPGRSGPSSSSFETGASRDRFDGAARSDFCPCQDRSMRLSYSSSARSFGFSTATGSGKRGSLRMCRVSPIESPIPP